MEKKYSAVRNIVNKSVLILQSFAFMKTGKAGSVGRR